MTLTSALRRTLIIVLTLLAAAALGISVPHLGFTLTGALIILAGAVVVLVIPVQRWGDWWYWYDRYLESPRWKALRGQVLARDDHTCQKCGTYQGVRYRRHIGNTVKTVYEVEPVLQAHHRPGTYQPWWWYWLRLPEPKRNIETRCRACHAAGHGKGE